MAISEAGEFVKRHRVMRQREVLHHVGIGRGAIYALILVGEFPSPVEVGETAVGWVESEVFAVVSARTSGATKAELIRLVADLAAKRHPELRDARDRL